MAKPRTHCKRGISRGLDDPRAQPPVRFRRAGPGGREPRNRRQTIVPGRGRGIAKNRMVRIARCAASCRLDRDGPVCSSRHHLGMTSADGNAGIGFDPHFAAGPPRQLIQPFGLELGLDGRMNDEFDCASAFE